MFSSEWKLQTFLDLSVQVVKGQEGRGERKKSSTKIIIIIKKRKIWSKMLKCKRAAACDSFKVFIASRC